MRTVGIKTLKNELSAYVRDVAAGETVLITDRGRVVAQLKPPSMVPDGSTADTEIMARLVREGIATAATTRMTGPPRPIDEVPFEQVMSELDADREDR